MKAEELRLASITVHEIAIPFRISFKHAAHVRRAAENLIVEIGLEGGATGWGEILPRDYVTGETLDSALEDAKALWTRELRTLALSRAEPPFSCLRPLYERAAGAKKMGSYSGFDVAVFNAWAMATGTSLVAAFGGRANEAAARVAPVGIGFPPRLTVLLARLMRLDAFKIKVGDPRGLERVLAVALAAPRGASLVLDANRALRESEATALLAALRLAEVAIDAFEEPLAGGDPVALARLAAATGVPIMADESLVTLTDAEVLTRHGAASWWNLRLAKNGGFSGLKALAAAARTQDVTLQLGALVGETGITEAAGDAALALLHAVAPERPLVRRESSFPKYLLRQDPAPSGRVNKAALKRWTQRSYRLL